MLISRKAAVWGERLRRYQRSALTVSEFCRQEGVSVPSFYQWRRRLAETSASSDARPQPSRRGPAVTPAFQQVTLAGSGVVAIELPSGVRMELPAQQLQLVRAVVAELLQAESASLRGDG
jgi:transposase-like protein